MKAPSHWTGAVVLALASVTCIPSRAKEQGAEIDLPVATAVDDEGTAGVQLLSASQQASQAEPESRGEAIYSPFSSGLFTYQEYPSAARMPSKGGPDLTMTLAASVASAVAFVWLLLRI
ncbi:hypothetical protein [Variovorax sp. dw_954]|nr:hypothetical protein [Variovorax sp. dw_954]